MWGLLTSYARGMNNLGATERRANTSKNWNFFFLRGNTDIHACAPGPSCESEQTEGNEKRSETAVGSRLFWVGLSGERSDRQRTEALTSGVVPNDQKEGQ